MGTEIKIHALDIEETVLIESALLREKGYLLKLTGTDPDEIDIERLNKRIESVTRLIDKISKD